MRFAFDSSFTLRGREWLVWDYRLGKLGMIPLHTYVLLRMTPFSVLMMMLVPFHQLVKRCASLPNLNVGPTVLCRTYEKCRKVEECFRPRLECLKRVLAWLVSIWLIRLANTPGCVAGAIHIVSSYTPSFRPEHATLIDSHELVILLAVYRLDI